MDTSENSTMANLVLLLNSTLPPLDLNQPDVSEKYAKLDRISKALFLYTIPILLVLGTLGNILCIVTMRSEKFRVTSMGFLLTALALADLIALYTGALRRWLIGLVKLDVRVTSVASCKIHGFLTYYSVHLSAWTLVLITGERLVSVLAPTRFNHLCSKRRIALGWLVVATLLLAMDLFLLVEYDLVPRTQVLCHSSQMRSNCSTACYICNWRLGSNCQLLTRYLHWSDFCLSCLLPTPVIIVGNAILIYKLVGLARIKLSISSARSNSRNNKKSSVTVMLIVTSVVFIITTLPINMFFVHIHHKPIDAHLQGLLYAIFSLCTYTNHSVNFFLYFISGSTFRQAALDLLRGFCSSSPESVHVADPDRHDRDSKPGGADEHIRLLKLKEASPENTQHLE